MDTQARTHKKTSVAIVEEVATVAKVMEEVFVRHKSRAMHWLVILVIGWGIGCSDDGASDRASKPSPAQPQASGGAKPAPVAPIPPASPPAPVEDQRSEAELIAQGRAVYNSNCIACHNMDPTKDGALGPAVAGASYELIEARVVRGEYPEGYKPKRDTRVMVALPHLQPKLKELAAYLDSLS